MQWAQNRWRTISPTDRLSWETYATNFPVPSRLNPDAYLGGQQLFMRHEMLNYLWGGATDDTAGDPFTITNPTWELFNDAGDLVFAGTSDAVDGDFRVLCFATPRLSVTQNIVKSKCRLVGNQASAGTTVTVDITTGFNQVYGYIPAVGDFVGAFFVLVADGNAAVIRSQPLFYEVMAA